MSAGASFSSIALRTPSSISEVAFLNSRMDLPKERKSSGRRLAPNRRSTTRKIRIISGARRFCKKAMGKFSMIINYSLSGSKDG